MRDGWLTVSEMNSKEQTTSFWQQILDKAQSTHRCMACDRDIQDKDAKAIEAYVRRCASSFQRHGLISDATAGKQLEEGERE
jgi:ribosomal protein L37AE/L43A